MKNRDLCQHVFNAHERGRLGRIKVSAQVVDFLVNAVLVWGGDEVLVGDRGVGGGEGLGGERGVGGEGVGGESMADTLRRIHLQWGLERDGAVMDEDVVEDMDVVVENVDVVAENVDVVDENVDVVENAVMRMDADEVVREEGVRKKSWGGIL